jgi:hypothetical protein
MRGAEEESAANNFSVFNLCAGKMWAVNVHNNQFCGAYWSYL